MIISDRGKLIFEGKESELYYDLGLIFKGLLDKFGEYNGETIIFNIYDDIKTYYKIKNNIKNRL